MNEVDISTGCVDITDEIWERILRLYLRTYRGPHADTELKKELEGYQVLIKDAIIAPGQYVRYMPRGIVDSELRRGGWVVKCNTKSIHLQDGRRAWRVSRLDNYIFVRNDDTAPLRGDKKTMVRILAEEALRKDDRMRSASVVRQVQRVPQRTDDEDHIDEEAPRVKYVAVFKN